MVVLVGTTTFAWLKLNPNAFFEEMEISISSNEDLKISVDGVHYKSSLSSVDIRSAIVAKAYDYTLVLDEENGGYNFYDEKTGKTIESSELNTLYSSTRFAPVTSKDGKHFYNLNGTEVKVGNKQFTQMDIYFESISDFAQDVYFSNKEITYEDGTVIPKTEIKVKDQTEADASLWGSALVSFDTFHPEFGDKISYIKRDDEPIPFYTAYASDAVRFSIVSSVDDGSGFVSTDHGIYEINKGFGSYATNLTEDLYSIDPTKTKSGAASAMYDATKNAAFTYYNNYKKYELDEGLGTDKTISPMDFNAMPKTFKGLDTVEAAKIITLNKANNYGRGGTAKMTVTFWLEGWDGDCIDMVLDQDVDIKLSFTNYNNVMEYDPVNLKYVVTDPSDKTTVVDTWTRTQIVGLPISDSTPAFVLGNTSHKFLYWGLKNPTTGEITEWDFTQNVVPEADNAAARQWTLVSVWE